MTVGEDVLRDKPGLLYENAYARAHAWWRWLSVQTSAIMWQFAAGATPPSRLFGFGVCGTKVHHARFWHLLGLARRLGRAAAARCLVSNRYGGAQRLAIRLSQAVLQRHSRSQEDAIAAYGLRRGLLRPELRRRCGSTRGQDDMDAHLRAYAADGAEIDAPDWVPRPAQVKGVPASELPNSQFFHLERVCEGKLARGTR